jgi:hypothetical protein
MNGAELFNDHTLHILLDDLVKARKSPELGPIRLQAFLDYAEKKSGGPFEPVVRMVQLQQEPLKSTAKRLKAQRAQFVADNAALLAAEPEAPPKRTKPKKKAEFKPLLQVKEEALPGGFMGEDDAAEAAVAPKFVGYLEQQRALRPDPIASLKQAADIVEAAIKENRWDGQGQMQVLLPKRMVVSGLEAILKDRRVPFTKLIVSLPPKNAEISAKTFQGLNPGADENRMRGAQGEKTAGWSVLVMK